MDAGAEADAAACGIVNPASGRKTLGEVTCEAWTNCDGGAEVEKCVIDGGGHTWPGGEPIALFGKTTQDISASDHMWDFFSRHTLP
ncbi:MAG: hypothetical protein DI536_29245 [Archangium gephyra]|uniref:Uncharacterized protein n=1 Tax=Archangium gephyra TaxID=48 RepID=A0A2W5SYW9_9BACT|nr:MAG: hypothetical protein DI536_29245 [Archangium gephyra]